MSSANSRSSSSVSALASFFGGGFLWSSSLGGGRRVSHVRIVPSRDALMTRGPTTTNFVISSK